MLVTEVANGVTEAEGRVIATALRQISLSGSVNVYQFGGFKLCWSRHHTFTNARTGIIEQRCHRSKRYIGSDRIVACFYSVIDWLYSGL